MTQENKAVIERAFGIIEGIACGVSDAASETEQRAIEAWNRRVGEGERE